MKLRITYDPKPGPSRAFDWSVYDEDTYDGAEDSKTRNQVGFGKTKFAALQDFFEILQDASGEGWD